jgi:hypothetical protein
MIVGVEAIGLAICEGLLIYGLDRILAHFNYFGPKE